MSRSIVIPVTFELFGSPSQLLHTLLRRYEALLMQSDDRTVSMLVVVGLYRHNCCYKKSGTGGLRKLYVSVVDEYNDTDPSAHEELGWSIKLNFNLILQPEVQPIFRRLYPIWSKSFDGSIEDFVWSCLYLGIQAVTESIVIHGGPAGLLNVERFWDDDPSPLPIPKRRKPLSHHANSAIC